MHFALFVVWVAASVWFYLTVALYLTLDYFISSKSHLVVFKWWRNGELPVLDKVSLTVRILWLSARLGLNWFMRLR